MSGRTLGIAVAAIAAMAVGALAFPVKLPHIQLPAEPIAHVGSLVITNTMLTGWITSAVLLFAFWRATTRQALVPTGLQNFVEFVSEFLLGLCESIAGPSRGRQFFPIVATIFLFVITSNWMGLLPGYGTIGIWEKPYAASAGATGDKAVKETASATKKDDAHATPSEKGKAESKEAAKDTTAKADDHGDDPVFVPLLRAATSDLNTTLAIALVSVIATQIYGIRTLGGEYVQRFFNFKEGPIGLYVGLLELIAEFAKILSFTFRLFGNIFAGEVLLAVIAFLLPWVALIPFLGLELFVGFIQAFVFAMLTLVFMALATTSHAQHGEPGGASHH